MASSSTYKDYFLRQAVAPRRSIAITSPTPVSPQSHDILRADFPDGTSSLTQSDGPAQAERKGSKGSTFPPADALPIGIARSASDDGKLESASSVTTSSTMQTDKANVYAIPDAPPSVSIQPVESVLYPEQIESASTDSLSPNRHPTMAPAVQSYLLGDVKGVRAFSPSSASMFTDITSPSYQAPPSNSNSNSTGRTKGTGATGRNMPEFFSHATFQIVLQSPSISHQLLKFSQSRLSGENMEFLAQVAKYHSLLAEVSKEIYNIHKTYISTSAPSQVNMSESLLLQTHSRMKAAFATSLPSLESIFVDAQSDIERLVFTDIYPKFVRHQMSLSAARALGRSRATSRYGGLGDCFVLTNPNIADNPITYASDGFVKVTGYQRNEIIPRNCRFLQCRSTDRAAVRRLKDSITSNPPYKSVELLLNEKKNGEPFWNLLYTTPLYDSNGRLAFFLGGQINCSTTIHNSSDVLRVLGQVKEPPQSGGDTMEAPAGLVPPHLQKSTSRSRTLLNAIRGISAREQTLPVRAPGMEDTLLERLSDQPMRSQFETFYTAYSHYIVVNYSSWLITFISSGIVDLLFPIKAKQKYSPTTGANTPAVGNDVFRFLGEHGTGSVGSEYKNTVKAALQRGGPVSLDLRLCARPYMGFETFLCHWTPLKDERGAVGWVVLTLGNERRAWYERSILG